VEPDRYYRIDIRVTADERDGLKREAMMARMRLGEHVRSLLGLPRHIKFRKGKVIVTEKWSRRTANGPPAGAVSE
jgi:hypothetical protein